MKTLLFCTLISLAWPYALHANGTVVAIKGSVKSVSTSKKSETTLKLGSVVKNGERVVTSKESYVVLRLTNNGAIRISEESELELNSLADVKTQHSLELIKGAVLSFFAPKQKLDGNKDIHRVQTKSSTIGVRGTAFFVKTEEGKPDYVCACNGKVAIQSGEASEIIESQSHDRPVMITSGKIANTDIKTGHNDSQIEELKSHVK